MSPLQCEASLRCHQPESKFIDCDSLQDLSTLSEFIQCIADYEKFTVCGKKNMLKIFEVHRYTHNARARQSIARHLHPFPQLIVVVVVVHDDDDDDDDEDDEDGDDDISTSTTVGFLSRDSSGVIPSAFYPPNPLKNFILPIL